MAPRFGFLRSPIRGLGLVGLAGLCLPLACSSGEIELRSGPKPIGSEPIVTGGDVGTGGTPPPIVEPASGGAIQNVGGSDSPPEEPHEDPVSPLPCLVTGACYTLCSPEHPNCAECESDESCPGVVPICDASFNLCVECLDDWDCERTYGPAFPECSRGLCVQCQRDEHCPPGDRCDNGWCGHCEGDWDCPPTMECFRNHCFPGPP